MNTHLLTVLALLALLIASCTRAEQPAPEDTAAAPEPAAPAPPAQASQPAPSQPAPVIVAEPTEPTVDVSSVDSLSDDVNLDELGSLEQELAELEQLS